MFSKRFWSFFAGWSLMALAASALMAAVIYYTFTKNLPEVGTHDDFQLEVPLRIFTADGLLLGEYGAQRRTPVDYQAVPEKMIQAFVSAEDDRFFEHPGVDYQGLIRAALASVTSGAKSQGGSTITMQVARNFFLSPEKSYTRKIREIFLSLEMERKLSKEEILSLYLNKIYLGKRAYGVDAAAAVYYGKELDELSLAQIAMIAGLPKAPSTYNPLVNPDRALLRRNYVLRRMHELGHISDEVFEEAKAEDISASLRGRENDLDAPYVTEMVRDEMIERYGDEAYSKGFNVYTTVNSGQQQSANKALQAALLAYDRRHGYRGALDNWSIDGILPEQTEFDEKLAEQVRVSGLQNAVITQIGEQTAEAYIGDSTYVPLVWEGIQWARKQISVDARGPEVARADEVLSLGDVVRLRDIDGKWHLAQEPEVQGAFVSLRAEDGAILSITGGYDYFRSKFNRATQAKRQPGSSLKPFLYSAALEKGYTAATVVNDAPVVFDDDRLETAWRPENYSGKVYGPTRLRKALTYSRNLVSIRVLRNTGIGHTRRHMVKFGLPAEGLPRDLSLSLGSASVTPMELATAYAVFSNGGFKVSPYLIDRIEDDKGEVIWQANAPKACDERCRAPVQEELLQLNADLDLNPVDQNVIVLDAEGNPIEDPRVLRITELEKQRFAPRVISAENAYIVSSMLQDVATVGTAAKAKKELQRSDLAGKTGTTNDQKDAWFAGFSGGQAAIAWVGFDKVKPMGRKEVGGTAALPMWIDYMRNVLGGLPEKIPMQPAGLTMVRISKESGLRVPVSAENSMFEVFRTDHVPPYEGVESVAVGIDGEIQNDSSNIGPGTDQLPPETIDDLLVDDIF